MMKVWVASNVCDLNIYDRFISGSINRLTHYELISTAARFKMLLISAVFYSIQTRV